MKKLFTSLALVAILSFAVPVKAQFGLFNAGTLVDSTVTTNMVMNYPTNWPAWPRVSNGFGVTNVTMIPLGNARELALQFTVGSTNNSSTDTIIWPIYKAVTPVYPTNNNATSIKFDLLCLVTNTMVAGASTVVASFGPGDTVTAASTADGVSTHRGIAGLGAVYIWGFTNTPGAGVTNYSVKYNLK